MGIDTTTEHDVPRVAAGRTQRRSVTGVIVGSLAVGLVLALALTLVVLPGATESVITGSVLLAFGLGWSLLAALSMLRSDQPQRWAMVPAAAMTVTGAGLLVLTPGDDTLTWLTWRWPPIVLTLTVWKLVAMRRSRVGRGRWLLTPVLVVLALASLGALSQSIATHRTQGAYAAPGDLVRVEGRDLHLDCRGEGSPTVVLFNGLGEISDSWTRVRDEIDVTTRVCAFDRAGQAWSDDVARPQDGLMAARDLQAVLETAGERGPFVLVGHSLGGPYAMTYASVFPDRVAGLVLLDASSPRQLTDIPSYPLQYAVMRRGLAVMPVLARLGLGGLLASGSSSTGDVRARLHAMTSTPRAYRNARDDIATLPTLLEQAQALTTLHGRPLAVITASGSAEEIEGWTDAQDQLATLSTDSVQRVVDSTHQGLLDDGRGAAESARAIGQVVDSVRQGTLLGAGD